MKIEGTGKAQGAAKAKKSPGASSADAAAFGEYMASASKETSASAATQSIAMVDALLAVQEAEDPAARAAKKRMRERAGTVLKELDKIRVAMLSGNLTVGHMVDIADVVASHREKISDPGLTAILDEIDLRAQVELAKMRVALDA